MPLQLFMLSPYRMPTHHALMLGDADTLAWQYAWRLLWHPALLRQCDQLPVIADAADHALPRENSLYVLPETPTPYLPENWDERVKQSSSIAVRTSTDWSECLQRLTAAGIVECDNSSPDAAACFALGFGYAILDTLFEAMDHQRTLDTKAFFAEVHAAASGDSGQAKAAAERLFAARETVYPAPIHLLDLAVVGQCELSRRDTPLNLIATAEALSALSASEIEDIRQRLASGTLEICGGIDHERPDAELSVESQLWNLRQGQQRTKDLTGQPASVYARTDTAFHPHTPSWLAQANLSKLLLMSFDGGIIPQHAAATIRWPGLDGRQVDAVTRAPLPARDPQTGFHLAMHLHKSIMHDNSAVVILRHGVPAASSWYVDWLKLSQFAPVFGTWTTVSHFLDESSIGEYAPATTMDDYSPDVPAISDPLSAFARHMRSRRRVDAALTYQALLQVIGSPADDEILKQIASNEDLIEHHLGTAVADVETSSSESLARRLVARGKGMQRGWLLLNSCPFTRRIGLQLTDMTGLPEATGPIKAVQRDEDNVRLVVEVPGLGYTWVPEGNAELATPRMTLAEGTTIRNECFEAEIDSETGALRTFRDRHGRADIMHQRLVWQPGSEMRADRVEITANGPALGELTTSGYLLDEHGQELATFVQQFRAWLGRPMLELVIQLQTTKPTSGFAWHDYYAARFVVPSDHVRIIRGVFGAAEDSTHHRPGSLDFLELHSRKNRVLIVTGGLPFAQRHGENTVDVLLRVAGETATCFQFHIGLNRPQPAQAAQAAITPVAVVPLDNGPPPAGATGWLMHLDTSHVLLTSLRPAAGPNAVIARFLEVAGLGGNVNLRFAREPRLAMLVDADGMIVSDAVVESDTVSFNVTAHELVNLRVEW